MKYLLLTVILFFIGRRAYAQVDVESRRVLMVQTELGVYHSNEQPGAFGYFWFNQNDFPWTNTALRVIFAGIFVDTELSRFLTPNTAIGVGAGGGLFLDSVYALI